MSPRLLRATSQLSVGLALGPSFAHLFALPNKMHLERDDYRTVQQIYRGWSRLGIVAVAALATTTAHALTRRGRWAAFAAGCLLAGQALFWSVTYPTNRATANWTVLPRGWPALRRRWEYSHAANALLNLAAFAALTAGDR